MEPPNLFVCRIFSATHKKHGIAFILCSEHIEKQKKIEVFEKGHLILEVLRTVEQSDEVKITCDDCAIEADRAKMEKQPNAFK